MTATLSHNKIVRRLCRRIDIGGVTVGGGAPIAVQALVSQPLSDLAAVIAEINALAGAGATLIRVACGDRSTLLALYRIISAAPV
ncbi:MAG: flavodoxin-dependent (E)-4-hydroxy-3-methylbut-2-enyl-diphosphate synthase, partial [Alphaproteobacteria bacterium]